MERSCDVTRARQAARRFAKPGAVPSCERNNAADGRPGTLLRRRRFWVVVGVERLGRNTATPGGGLLATNQKRSVTMSPINPDAL
jgi:hypothetical protein